MRGERRRNGPIRSAILMNRLERVRSAVDRILGGRPDEDRRTGFVHLYGVSATCTMLGMKRGIDPELCAVAGMLHDIATYESGDSTDHALRGSGRAGEILTEVGGFTDDEVDAVCEAISTHSAKGAVHGPTAELLKDADLLQHYLYNPGVELDGAKSGRVQAILTELRLDGQGNCIEESA